MSKGPNHRRGEKRGQDSGPTWEGPTPNCGGTHVARARKSWKDIGRRAERRTGKRGANKVRYGRGEGKRLPSVEEGLEEYYDDELAEDGAGVDHLP